MKAAALCLALAALAAGCGYHVAGQADLLPKQIRTIAIPAFGNNTARYRLTQQLPAALTREFLSRTRYRIVADPKDADAVLHGGVASFYAYPTIFDSRTGRASGMMVMVTLDLRLIENATGKTVYQNPSMTIQKRYEISADQEAYFEESDSALIRLSQDVANTVVSAILENF